jgi:serine/threonine protein kinase
MDKYIDVPAALQKEWIFQLVEAVVYIHSKGIVHLNLSTTNVLVHRVTGFGGSQCQELNSCGGLLPDTPFLAPLLTQQEFDLPKLEVFSLGVLMYIIVTGHFPFYQVPAPQVEERRACMVRVQERLDQGDFPDLSDLQFRDIIVGCCLERRFVDAGEELKAPAKIR